MGNIVSAKVEKALENTEAIRQKIEAFDNEYEKASTRDSRSASRFEDWFFYTIWDEMKLSDVIRGHPDDPYADFALSFVPVDKRGQSCTMGTRAEECNHAKYHKYQAQIDRVMAETGENIRDTVAKCLETISDLRDKQWQLTGSCSQQLLDERVALNKALLESIEGQRGVYMSSLIHQAGELLEQLDIAINMAGIDRSDMSYGLAGVYFLLNREDGIIEYIGRSVNIKKRLSSNHHAYDKQRHVICIANIEDAERLKEVERILIRELSPCLNRSNITPRDVSDGLTWTIKKMSVISDAPMPCHTPPCLASPRLASPGRAIPRYS